MTLCDLTKWCAIVGGPFWPPPHPRPRRVCAASNRTVIYWMTLRSLTECRLLDDTVRVLIDGSGFQQSTFTLQLHEPNSERARLVVSGSRPHFFNDFVEMLAFGFEATARGLKFFDLILP